MSESNDDVAQQPGTEGGGDTIAAAPDAPSNGAPAAPSSQEPSASAPPPNGVAMIARLRAEADATEDPTRKAVLLHEAGELEERVAGDELGAAREYLAAFNLEGTFREPLEALVRILERRRSLKNLGRVLESLSKAAESPEERARAFRSRASDAADVRQDRGEATDMLEQAIDADAGDATSWLMLELDAGTRSDHDTRKRALAHRVELTSDPKWAAQLRIDLAESRALDGDIDDALDVLTEVVTSRDESAWRACEVAERLARKGERSDREAWALVQRGEIILESLTAATFSGMAGASPTTLREEAGPRGRGVPPTLRRPGVAADAFVRAASAYRNVGRIEDELASLERAIQVDPTATMPHLARIAAATRLGDVERASVIANHLVERGARPELAPQLWLSIAEAALARGDREAVLHAAAKLLEAAGAASDDEGSRAAIVPKTLLVDLLLDGSDPSRLVGLIEDDASARPTDEGKARGTLVAATASALFATDSSGAKTALARAATLGADKKHVARLARGLAAATGDVTWYEEASVALRAVATDANEASDVDLDLARVRLSRGDKDGAREALAAITEGPRAQLSRVLRVALAGDAADDALLASLANGTEGEPAIAFAVARAVRATRREDEPSRAAALEALGAASADDELAALTRASAALKERPSEAATVLRDLARSVTDPGERDVLRIAAALLIARSGALDVSLEIVEELETEAQRAIAPARAVWLRHAAQGDEQKRRIAMAAMAKEVFAGGGFSALERAADRLAAPDEGDGSIEEALAQLVQSEESGLVRAGLLLQAAWPDGNITQETKDDALRTLESLGGDAARQVTRAALRKATRDGDSTQAVIAAEAWHQMGGATPAAIEMLVGAEQSADSEAEVRGRSALARSLTASTANLIAASASIAAHVAGLPAPALPAVRDDASLALAQAELAAPGCDPMRREVALRAMATVLPASSATLHEMAAWSALARSDHDAARALFAQSLELAEASGVEDATREPRSAIEGSIETELLSAGGRPTPAWAELVERLARVVDRSGDTASAAGLFEQVGHAWWDSLADPKRGEAALAEAFKRDPKRRPAFDRVFRAIRARKEDDQLLAIVGRRLESTDDPPEMAKLFWEQARVLRSKGDRDAALNSLENVTMLEPDHVGALALSAEIYVGRQMYLEAATALDRLSRQPVPVQQKLGAGLGAADLYEAKLDDAGKALDVLLALDKAGISDVAIHERIARAAARAEAWVPATAYLEKLIAERAEPQGRKEAAQLAAAIYRDRLDDPQAAVPALVALLRESPDDAEAIEQLLDANPNPQTTRDTLMSTLGAARSRLLNTPSDVRFARIVARICTLIGEANLTQIALGVIGALDEATQEEARAEQALLARMGSAPAVSLDPQTARRLAAPEEEGPILNLFRIMGPTIAEALGPTTDTLSVGRRERVDARAGSPLRNEIAAWAGALGIAEFELYVGGKDANLIQGVPAEMPAIVVGAGVRTPLSLVDRARMVRELVALERGTTVALLRDDVAVAAVIVASCAIVEVPLKTPAYSVLAETQRMINKAISRKTKKVLPETAQAIARQLGGGGDLRTFRGHALRTLDRAAVLASGEPAAALAGIVGPDLPAAKVAADPRAQAMLRFVWSDDYLALRRQLGLGIG